MATTLIDMPRRESESIRINKELARRARMIAAARGISLPEYLEEKLGPIVERDFPRMVKSLSEEASKLTSQDV